MTLETADWQDLLPVFRETYEIWSPGLTRRDYLVYQEKQANHPWARRNIRHLTLKEGGKIASSLKFSTIDLQLKGESFRVAGIGAVYTQLACRNQGFASQIMQEAIELAEDEKFQGVLLFSDIDCNFYARFGFEEIGAADLLIHLPSIKGKPSFPPNIKIGDGNEISLNIDGDSFQLESERFRQEHIDFASRYYRRWLRARPYGIDRDPLYYSFKLMRETFLHDNSRLAWPALSITRVSKNGEFCGYTITENAGGVLRILEMAAERSVREAIWSGLLVKALNDRMMRIRAWEGLAADFAPGFNLKQLINRCGLSEILPPGYKGQLNYYERTWGKGMILPLDQKLEELHMTAPCPLVELDHL